MIRAATTGDAPRIAALLHRNMPHPWTEDAVRAALSSPTSVLWVREDDAMLSGVLILQLCLDEAEILTIATEKARRRQGIGRSLMEYALREVGPATVFLEVRAENTGAKAFYEALGFTPYGLRKRYYRDPVDDAILMKFVNFLKIPCQTEKKTV
ncbi:MAG: ribosomal-protein-alanine N-acetyltransferase [Ruminococcaceae bacterium]|nr:ribosomal-protein-alanine N-acetyltransferase [Oscillospiraceae bacterium]